MPDCRVTPLLGISQYIRIGGKGTSTNPGVLTAYYYYYYHNYYY